MNGLRSRLNALGGVICLLTIAAPSDAQTPVYYSVGSDGSNLRSSPALTVTISSGTATFSEPQADNIGVGDEITYGGATIAYIAARTSSTIYTVTTAIGAVPPDVAGSPVNAIGRAFTTFSLAENNSDDGSHLATTDLVVGGYQLNWVCYDDAPMNDAFIIDGYATGPANYIHIYTPVAVSEVGVSQRHNGTEGTGFSLAPIDAAPVSSYSILSIREDYVRITGIEIDGSGVSNAQDFRAIRVESVVPATSDIRLDSLLVHDIANSSINQATADGDVFIVFATGGSTKISNSIFYRFEQFNNRFDSSIDAIRFEGPGTHYVHNVTIYDIKNTVGTGSTRGVENFSALSVAVRNVAVFDVVNTASAEECFSGTFTESNNVSSDLTAAGAGSRTGQTAYASYFVSVTPSSEDLHLLNDSASLWTTVGMDLDGDPNLPVTVDIDGETRHATEPDIGADEFSGECTPLSTTEGATTITVTAPGSFEMVFNQGQGGSLEKYYDLVEDPTRLYNLAGKPAVNFFGLFHDSIVSGGILHTSGTNTNGAELQLLEATPTRVRVRQENFFQRVGASTILPGIKSYGDYTIYPSGKMGLHWNRKTTAAVAQTNHPLEVSARREVGPDPRDIVTLYHDAGTVSPRIPGDSDFVLAARDTAGARADMLAILHQDWALASQLDISATATFASWRDLSVGGLASGLNETWNLLFYHKPTNFTDNTDVNVLERRDDYRGADPVTVISAGSGWNENTADGDFFNESEGAYTFDFDMTTGLTLEMDGAATNRFSPFFKIRGWRSLQDPVVMLESVALANNADFSADVKPFSRAFFAQDVTWSSTLHNAAAVTAPEVGTGGTVTGSDFQPSPYGSGARFDLDGEYLTLPAAGNFDTNQGSIEFWYQPNYTYGAGAASDDHGFFGYNIDANNYFYGVHQPYLGGGGAGEGIYFRVSSGGTISEVILGSGPAFPVLWRANDWVHLRFSWNLGSNLEVYVNGDLRGSVPYTVAPTLPGDDTFYIGERNTGGTKNNNAEGIIDEFRIYSTPGSPTPIAHAGLTASGSESLASGSNNFTLDFTTIDGSGRGEYAYFGADAKFHGLNVALATPGAGAVDLQWQYWNAVSGSWDNLEQVPFGFTDETNNLTDHGTIYWTSDPTNWGLYSLAGGPDLFYVRAYLASGAYAPAPVERFIKTDILLFQYCGHVTLDDQEFSFAVPTPTAVDLESFAAVAVASAVELSWRTASELDNLGFHLYRALSVAGPYERVTSHPIPGLGSSPIGASYRYVDEGLTNGVTYFYQLEDLETTGRTERHGPVSAMPVAVPQSGGEGSPSAEIASEHNAASSLVTYGNPSANTFRVLERGKDQLILELVTEGFYAEPQEDGSVHLEIPGLEALGDVEGVAIPVKRAWVEAIAGREVELVAVTAREVEVFSGLHPSDVEPPEIEASPDGTVRVARRRARAARKSFRGPGLYPEEAARIVSVGFQGETKKALTELAPMRWDRANGQLLLARRLVVRLSFRGRDRAEQATDGVRGRRYRKQPSHTKRGVVARFATTERGLHAVRYEDVFRGARGVRTSSLRLSRQDEVVAFHVEPDANRFEPGATLFFVSEGAAANPFGVEAVYELETGRSGAVMSVVSSVPSGAPTSFYWKQLELEENRLYQAALVDAPDLWLWDVLFAPAVKQYPFVVSGLAPSSEPGRLIVWLQGASDLAGVDHHVRVFVNGTLMDELRWDGKQATRIDVELASSVLIEGDNVLELENVGDTAAEYSMVMLDRFRVSYSRFPESESGELEGSWSGSGVAEITGIGADAYVVDTTHEQPRWLTGTVASDTQSVLFRAETGSRYLATSAEALRRPEVRGVRASSLKSRRNRADYIVLGPKELIQEAEPLLELRRRQGLKVKAVSIEEIYSEFGFGESTPSAVREFLSYAYHNWRRPSLRYVVLLGDATFDFKDYLATGVRNQVPPQMVKTSYLWTASDPAYAAVNGEDMLPDLAIGRLPAATVDDARALVDKIVSYELGDTSLSEVLVLIADDADEAGDFVSNANELASGVLSGRDVRKIYLSELGTAATRAAILEAFDEGASLTSYIGHGGIHLWANELLFRNADVSLLSPQKQQPLLLTMNCLNGYFHFPYFNSLAEELVKAEGRGAIAAVAPSGLSLNTPAHQLHQALLQEILHGNHERLGDAVMAAQEAYARTGMFPELVSIYHLFGDPALTLR